MSFQLYEGIVEYAEKHHDGNGKDWLLVKTYGNAKPVVWPWGSYKGLMFTRGSKVSVEASEGEAWFFAKHRDSVVDSEKAQFDIEGLANNEPGRTQFVVRLIMRFLQEHDTVCADDIYEEAVEAFPTADARFIGHGFRVLARQKVIHRIGMKNSSRKETDHARPLSLWHLTKTKGPSP